MNFSELLHLCIRSFEKAGLALWISASTLCAVAKCTKNQWEQRGKSARFILYNAHHSHSFNAAFHNRTLLQLKAGCQACGHQASLHRKLTSIDRYIGDEVKKAKKQTCCHLIPTREIPRSPLFEPYDLIPLPSDDQCTNEDNASLCRASYIRLACTTET